MKTEDLLNIYKILFDENLVFKKKVSFAITYDLKVVVFKMVSSRNHKKI